MEPCRILSKVTGKTFGLPFWGLLVFGSLQAQSQDSLKQALTQRWQSDPQATTVGLKAYAANALATDNRTEFAWALNFQGVVFGALGELDSSYQYYAQSLEYCRVHGIKEIEKKTLMNLAINYQYQGKYVEAASQYMDALRIFDAEKDTLGMGHAYSGLGGVSNYMGEQRKAITYYAKAIQYYEGIHAVELTGIVWSNMGTMYRDLGIADSALLSFERAETLLTGAGNQLGLANLYSNLGGFYEFTDRDKARGFYAKGFGVAQQINYPRGTLVNGAGMARLWLLQRDYPQAIKYGESTMTLAIALDDRQFQSEALKVLHESYAATGQPAKAYASLLHFKSLSDSISGSESKQAVAELEIKYETAKKEKEIAQQRITIAERDLHAQESAIANARLSLWLTALGATLIIFLLGGLWLWWVQREKRRQLQQELRMTQQLEAEKRAKHLSDEKLRISRELHDNIGSQITYIVSSLDNLSYYSTGPEAMAKVGQIAGYGREALGDLRQAIWALHVDAGFADFVHRVSELAMRHFPSESLNVQQDVLKDRKLDTTEAINMLRIVQEALQNAAKYSQASQLQLNFRCDKQGWCVEIIDNGVGFDLTAPPQGEGLGIEGMRARAAAIQARLKIDAAPGAGTRITLQKP